MNADDMPNWLIAAGFVAFVLALCFTNIFGA